ncbi:MAG TPA: tetratricopeptide repeat protein [Kofleriaceae bacterium]|nr:tetratricopeptide repeat protein [Kofleriaceae bacterium]
MSLETVFVRMRSAALIAALGLAPVGVGCGGSEPPTERPRSAKKLGPAEVLAKARADRDAGRIGEAIKGYRRVLRMSPNHYDTTEELADLLAKQGEADAAVELTKTYFDAKPGDPRGYEIYAKALVASRNYNAAFEILEQLLELDGKNAAAYDFRARVQVLQGKFQEAIADARKAVELAPDSVEYRINLGSALQRAGNQSEAAIELRSALQLDENNARAHLLLGIVLRDNFEAREALSHHEAAARLAPDNDRMLFELGLTRYEMGDPVGAEASLRKATELAPGDATNWYAYGQILRAQEKWTDAVGAYRKALEIDPKHPQAYVKLGFVLYYEGKLDEAEVILTAALRQTPDDPYVYWNLGQVYEKGQKYKLALEAYEKFIAMAPADDGDVPKAKKLIRALKRKVR